MQFQKILYPLIGVGLVAGAYHSYGWRGVAVAVTLLVMWLLLHFTRIVQVLQRAANRPVGYVDSAVMLNAKLKSGVTLLQVIAMTRALGELKSPDQTQPELFRWTDDTESYVNCEFHNGKLKKWELVRPAEVAQTAIAGGVSEAP